MEPESFKDVKKHFVGLKSIERRIKFNRCEWDDPAEVALYARIARSSERNAQLDKLVKNRVCPVCECLKIHSRSWVINKEGTEAICRACFYRCNPPGDVDKTSKIDVSIFSEKHVRYRVDHSKFTRARSVIRIGVAEFARNAGWSTSYQYKLEDGSVKTISADVADVILEVFARFGYFTNDEL